MEVKLVVRTLEVFELYAREVRPLSLTELSKGLDAPISSTLALVRTLVAKGFLYETRKRAGYYPTKRLVGLGLKIDAGDPVIDLIHPNLVALRDSCGESVVLGKRQDLNVIYLDIVQSTQAISYRAEPGEMRSLYANSIGKALFSVFSEQEQRKIGSKIKWTRHTDQTLSSLDALLQDAALSASRGWAANIGESVPDLAAIAIPFSVAGEWYAVSIAGPIARMQAQWDSHAKMLQQTVRAIEQALSQNNV